MTDKNVERASVLDTATLSDALDKHGLNGQCYKIKPRTTDSRMTGRAWTLLYGPAGSPAGTVGDYIDDVAPGSVVVLDNGGRENATVWGDILTEVAHAKGIAGTMIDGINRDTSLALKLGYPIYAKDSWMRTGKDRVQVEATGIPVWVCKLAPDIPTAAVPPPGAGIMLRLASVQVQVPSPSH
jgi:regulator of RNase E activity RraA